MESYRCSIVTDVDATDEIESPSVKSSICPIVKMLLVPDRSGSTNGQNRRGPRAVALLNALLTRRCDGKIGAWKAVGRPSDKTGRYLEGFEP